jgi:hypothetical protein
MPSKGWDKIIGAIRPNQNLPDFLMILIQCASSILTTRRRLEKESFDKTALWNSCDVAISGEIRTSRNFPSVISCQGKLYLAH